ncbi:hypothetical protein [Streptomyces sp. SAI-090]|uniref:hypothetical protein n=1 Tax=Streptomyces sp. SAI-090 TaxID=2940545 RepID=UPI00247570B7|nr:hypothetical protein [Streptomyces sp. SAI-090]
MEIVILQVRVLAEAAPRVWLAVSGTLAAQTRDPLRQRLRTCIDQGYRELFLDLRQLRCADPHDAALASIVFALGSGVRCHLIGAPAEIGEHVGGDPRIVLHARLGSAWREWE